MARVVCVCSCVRDMELGDLHNATWSENEWDCRHNVCPGHKGADGAENRELKNVQ